MAAKSSAAASTKAFGLAGVLLDDFVAELGAERTGVFLPLPNAGTFCCRCGVFTGLRGDTTARGEWTTATGVDAADKRL